MRVKKVLSERRRREEGGKQREGEGGGGVDMEKILRRKSKG